MDHEHSIKQIYSQQFDILELWWKNLTWKILSMFFLIKLLLNDCQFQGNWIEILQNSRFRHFTSCSHFVNMIGSKSCSYFVNTLRNENRVYFFRFSVLKLSKLCTFSSVYISIAASLVYEFRIFLWIKFIVNLFWLVWKLFISYEQSWNVHISWTFISRNLIGCELFINHEQLWNWFWLV